jgi:hypothetical protein
MKQYAAIFLALAVSLSLGCGGGGSSSGDGSMRSPGPTPSRPAPTPEPPPVPTATPDPEVMSLINHNFWEVVEGADCPEGSFGPENTGGEFVFEVLTDDCKNVTVTQPSLVGLRAGDFVRLRLFHEELSRPRGVFASIQNIFDINCTGSACHLVSSPSSGNMSLDVGMSYDNLVGQPSTISMLNRVERGLPDESFIIKKLTADLFPGEGTPMPLGAPRLSPSEITQITDWIANGAEQDNISVEANVFVSIGGDIIFSALYPIPSAFLSEDLMIDVSSDYPEGSAITFHVDNHGANAYGLIELSVTF